MKTILFACVHNAGRSQMAALWFNRFADPTKARAISAGTAPGARLHPEVIQSMSQVGFDLTQERPKLLTDELAAHTSMLITMGCGEACPVVPGARREDWDIEDPKGKPEEEVTKIREDLKRRVQELIGREGWSLPLGG